VPDGNYSQESRGSGGLSYSLTRHAGQFLGNRSLT
jgi:hypothetical protein